MSSVAQLQQELIATYVTRAAPVLFLYEYITTLSEEVDVIWCRKWTATTWLYALTCYSTVLDQIVFLIPDWNFVSCKVEIRANNVLQLIRYLCFAWFSALRVYALSDGRFLTAGVVLLLNLVPFATNMFDFITSVVVEDSDICTAVSIMPHSLLLSLSLVTRIAVIVGDLLVLAVTWTRTAQAYREAQRLHINAPLVIMLLRDGTIYFTILLILNILQVLGVNVSALSAIYIIQPFFDVLPSIIVCRFILNLRQIEPREVSWVSGNDSRSIRFVGNMGQSLQLGEVAYEDKDEDAEEDRYELGEYLTQADSSHGIVIREGEDVAKADEECLRRHYGNESVV